MNILSEIRDVRGSPPAAQPTRLGQGPGHSQESGFKAVLASKLRFSAHAAERLAERKIELGPAELGRISSGLEKAERKGARESLLLLGDIALVVSVPNRTVITALSGSRAKDTVFTNIDSAVVV